MVRADSSQMFPKVREVPKSDVSHRLRARCTACGHKGATSQHPDSGVADVGFLPFPTRYERSNSESNGGHWAGWRRLRANEHAVK